MKISKLIQKLTGKKILRGKSEIWKLKGHKYMLKFLNSLVYK